jgi:hypothetical protein
MDEKVKYPIKSKLIYGILSTLFIIVLFFLFFGLFVPFIIGNKFNPARAIGVVINGVGSFFLLFALYKPLCSAELEEHAPADTWLC